MPEGAEGKIVLEPVTADNWRECAALRVRPDQERFVAPVTYYLCLCTYGDVWRPRAIVRDGVVGGFCMWGVDEDGSRWIGGLVVDVSVQREGLARGAVVSLLAEFESAPDFAGSALSYSPDNTAARSLYVSLGFRETDEWIDDGAEIVARRS